VFLCGLLLACACGAQTPLNTVRKVILPGGARLLLKPESPGEIVAVTVFVRMEPDASPMEAAIGKLVANALFFGSQNRSFDMVADSVAQVGGSLETLRTPDYVAITCVTVPAQLREAIYLLCETLKNADFAPEALVRARQSVAKERREHDRDSFLRTYDALCDAARALPEPEDRLLGRVGQEQAQTYFRRRYLPENTVITVVGRFNPERVQDLFDSNLSDYVRAAPRHGRSDPRSLTPDSRSLTFTAPGSIACALLGTSAPGVASPDYPAFTVLHALLGGGHASRLFRRVREETGFSYTVGANWQADRSALLVAYLQWDNNRAATSNPQPPLQGRLGVRPQSGLAIPNPQLALKLLDAQLDSVTADPPAEAEVARARNVAVGQDALRHERARDRAFFLGWYEVMGLGYAFDAELPKRLAAVTPADVLRVAQKYLPARASAVALPGKN
jgi:predicted Zn-dependent peptidase